jgi:hypothetical protein
MEPKYSFPYPIDSIVGQMNLLHSFIHQWLYIFLLGPGLFLGFVIFFYTDGRTPWTRDQPVARPLPTHRTTQTHNKHTETSMPRGRFEPTIPASERVEIVHALDRTATVTGSTSYFTATNINIFLLSRAGSSI